MYGRLSNINVLLEFRLKERGIILDYMIVDI